MKRIVFFIAILPFLLIACKDGFSRKKAKDIIELTPKLTKESDDIISINPKLKGIANQNFTKLPTYKITQNTITSAPDIGNGKIYFMDNNGKVYAFSKEQKKVIWSESIATKEQNDYIGGGITFYNDKLYITNGSRCLIILDANTGHELSRKQFADIIRVKPIILYKNIILIQTISNNLIAYSTLNSDIIWQHEGITETISSSTYVTPIIYNNKVITCYNSGQLFALNSETGQEEWVVNLFNELDVSLTNFEPTTLTSDIIIEDHYIYITGSTGKLMKVDATSGNIMWSMIANDIQSMTLNGNSLFIINNAKQIAVINKMNGKVIAVAEIFDPKDKEATKFMSPIISKSNNDIMVNIISNKGKMYNFKIVNNTILEATNTTDIPKTVEYSSITPCGCLYLVTDKKLILLERSQ